MSRPKLLAIDSNVDLVTRLALAYREPRLYSLLEAENRVELLRRQGEQATRASVQPLTQGADLDMLFGVGHGTKVQFQGSDSQSIFEVSQYVPSEVRGRCVHLTSCSTAHSLGPDMVRNGATFFIGYVQDILFPAELASYIFDADAEIDRALVGGLNAGQAQQKGLDRFDQYIRAFARNRRAPMLVQFLAYNRNILRGPLNDPAYGDRFATL